MKHGTTTQLLLSMVLFLALFNPQGGRAQDRNFDRDWRFHKGKANNAQQIDYDDSQWRALDLPHDWAIEGPFSNEYNARCGGLPFHGTGWYRKSFETPKNAKGNIVRLAFEGAMYDAHVYVNGTLVGNRPYGYIGFEFDITKHLKPVGQKNIVAVRLTPQDLSTRWYPGAGIYRSTWLKIDNLVHVAQYGTYITTPTATKHQAVIQNETTVKNQSKVTKTVTVEQHYFDTNGKEVASTSKKETVPANGSVVSATFTSVNNPQLWDVFVPNLYKAKTIIKEKNTVLDTYETTFGIRHIEYTKEGFFLNGRKVRFNGVCLHHDNGALGAAVYERADERKLEIMKQMGVNAIRTSHNPPSQTLLDLCDKMGLLVQDEAFDVWRKGKVENGYNLFYDGWSEPDLKDMIRRDRNHPSIVMWSIGNEILEQNDAKNGWQEGLRLNRFCKEMDPTRPTSAGFNYYPAPFKNNLAQQVDIPGMNYKPAVYGEVHEKYPDLPILGSETSSCVSSRGVYHLPIEMYEKHVSNHVTSYDIIGPVWAYPPDMEFHFLEQNNNVMGEFIWTGFDYLGEPTPYGGRDNSTNGYWNDDWPSHASYFGAVDLCGFPKDRFFLYQSQWTKEPMIHLLPHWNWKGMDGKTIPVFCYTNCEQAELFVNGKSFGKKTKGVDKTTLPVKFNHYDPTTFESPYRLSWDVPYKAGEIKVVGYTNGKITSEKVIRTAGKPYAVKVSADRQTIAANGKDLSYLTVDVVDRNGNVCPLADNVISFKVEGEGDLIAVDNGDQTSLASFQANTRNAFSGKCLGIVRSSYIKGVVKVKVGGKGLKSQTITLKTE